LAQQAWHCGWSQAEGVHLGAAVWLVQAVAP
jgi:hypothetical protein